MRFLERRPFVLRLLHPVLAEVPLALCEERLDRRRRLRLAHRDQCHLAGIAPGDRAGLGDAGANLGKRSVCHFHRAAL